MKTIRKDWPRVRSYVKGGNTYYQVDLRRKHYKGQKWRNFTSRDEALKFATATGDKIAKQGLNSLTVETEDKRVKAWAEQCAIYGKSIEDAITVALGVFEKQRKVKESPYMAELLTVWVDDKVTNELKPLRPKTIKSIRNMAEMFKNDFGMSRMKEIDSDRIERYLKDKDVSNQTRKNLLSYLRQPFLHLALPLADLRRVHLILPGDLGHGLISNQRFQSDLRFECSTVSFPFCFHLDVCSLLVSRSFASRRAGQQTPKSLT